MATRGCAHAAIARATRETSARFTRRVVSDHGSRRQCAGQPREERMPAEPRELVGGGAHEAFAGEKPALAPVGKAVVALFTCGGERRGRGPCHGGARSVRCGRRARDRRTGRSRVAETMKRVERQRAQRPSRTCRSLAFFGSSSSACSHARRPREERPRGPASGSFGLTNGGRYASSRAVEPGEEDGAAGACSWTFELDLDRQGRDRERSGVALREAGGRLVFAVLDAVREPRRSRREG